MLFTDLFEVKKIAEIDPDDKSEDVKLGLLIEWASAWIEEALNRTGFMDFKQRTEYINGSGTLKLRLRARPVFVNPLPQVFVDEGGFFGSVTGSFDTTNSAWIYGSDFCLKLDQSDNLSSRSGILIGINQLWPRQNYRQQGFLSPFVGEGFGNVKVIYTGGYTVDSLPSQIRAACNLLVARLNYIFPLGMELNSESYLDRSISPVTSEKTRLMSLIFPMIAQFKNHKYG